MNKLSIEDERLLRSYYDRYGGYWRFPEVLDYCYLVNPYFNQSGIIKEMQDFFPVLVSQYPSGMNVNASLAAQCWNVKSDYIVVGNGAAELIKAIIESVEGTVGIIRPTFEEYPNRLDHGRVVTFIPDNAMFRYNENDLINYFTDHKIDTLLLINPDNPSGNFITVDGIHKLARWCKTNDVKFILDESFVDFSIGFEDNTFVNNKVLEMYPTMTVIKSISKSYGVPGLRLGIMCSSDIAMISRIKKEVSIWNINSFAEYFMQIYPKYSKEYKCACEKLIEAREEFENELKKVPYIKVMPSQANYFFLEVLPPYTPKELCAILLKKYNILCSACLAKKGIAPNKYMRIAVRSHADNRKFIEAINKL